MSEKQRTIKESVSYSGIGLHTGQISTITFKAAPENYGYKFIRTDLPEEVEIPALVDNVVDLSRGTTLGIGDVKVHTVEHVLAALAGLQIDNCRIELSGIEPPVGDGSSIEYVSALMKAGFEEQNAERNYFIVDETIRYTNEDLGVDIVALPTDQYRITVMIDYHNPALGSQHTGMFNLENEFVTEFASSRTFCFLTEIEYLAKQGLIKGGNIDNAIVIVDKDMQESELVEMQKAFNLKTVPFLGKSGILNDTELRFKNEPARHKLLDMLGDLALCGFPMKAQILAARPGHASNFQFAKKIRNLYLKKSKEKQEQKSTEDLVLDINNLLQIMPHRYPFLLVDKIVEFNKEKNTVTGIKNVTFNEPFFTGHFPEKPVMPGVLICEAMAQTGCMLVMNNVEDITKIWVFFLGIKNAKFKKLVIPGDQLVMKMKLTAKKLNTFMFQGTAYVDGQPVAEAEIQAAMVKREN